MKKLICSLILSLFISYLYGQENTIYVNGAKLYYKVYGKGQPILIINGGPGMNSNGFEKIAIDLSRYNRTILYDQRGTGQSTLDQINENSISMDLMVEDLEALRRHLNLESWTVLGHSFGGMLAYYYATKYPESISAMIQSSSGGMDLTLLSLLNIRESLSQVEWDSLQYYQQKLNAGDTTYQVRLKRGEFMAPAYLYNMEYIPELAVRMTQGNSQINGLLWENMRTMQFDTKDELHDFKKPVLIIHGKNDLLDTSVAESAHDILPNSRLEVLDNCAHYGWLDRPDVFYTIIHEFLSSIE